MVLAQSFRLNMPTTLLFGQGTVKDVGSQVRHIGAKKVMIVTDAGVVKAGHLDTVNSCLEAARCEVVAAFDSTEAQPTIPTVERSTDLACRSSPDVIVGLGGGSCMDVAKMTATLAVNGGAFLDYVGVDKVPRRGLPIVLLPTTSGTGSGVSRAAAIRDPQDNRKKLVVSPLIVSTVTIVDPVLTATMPPSVTASSGIDALSHAIEGYLSVNAARLNEMTALEAIGLIAANLGPAYSKGDNLEARTGMALGNLLAAIAINAGGCAPHALSFVVGAESGVNHGIAVYVVLPAILEYSIVACPDKIAATARAMGVSTDGLSLTEAAVAGVQAIRALGAAIGLPAGLSDIGVKEEQLPKMAEAALSEKRLLGNHPRKLSREDIVTIFEMAY